MPIELDWTPAQIAMMRRVIECLRLDRERAARLRRLAGCLT